MPKLVKYPCGAPNSSYWQEKIQVAAISVQHIDVCPGGRNGTT
jgi:hypothetical protein